MSSAAISEVTDRLGQTKVAETVEVSFKGKGLKLDKKEDAKEIIEAIENQRDLTVLRLEGNTLGIEAAEAIGEVLKKCPNFQRALWSDMFTGRLKSEIPSALKHLGAAIISAPAYLVELDLSDNAFGPNGVEGIVDLLKSESCYTLQELRLNNNGLGTTGGKMLAGCLMDCYTASKAAGKPLSLRVFISGRGRLENEGSTALSEVFKLMGTLEEVAMPQNGINHQGISALAAAFSDNPNLRVLNLNDNTFTESGARAVAKILPKLQNLEVINFGDCLVRTDGAKAIAKALRQGHKKLREFNLSGNEIGKSGANAVVSSMENKECLEALDLNANQFGSSGVEEIQLTLAAIGKEDALGTLSDDEGTDDEGEDGDYDENGEDEGAEDVKDGDHVDDPQLQIHGKGISPQKQSVKDFLSFPSPSKLHQHGSSLIRAIKSELGEEVDDVDATIHKLVRLSSIVTEGDAKTKQAICDCADETLKQLFSEGDGTSPVLVANAYLVYLGLMKGEDKKYKPPSDISGPLLVLEHIVRQDYFPNYSRKILSGCLDRPNPLLDKSTSIRNKLLQTLYSA